MSWEEIDKISDDQLEELERKLFKLYNDAAKAMSGTIQQYFKQFEKRDAEMKEALDKGEITKQQYIDWRLTQISRGKRYEDLRDKLAERATKANETAVAYVNDKTPGIYTLNMNYTAYNIEQSYGDIGFTVWNEEAVRRLAMEEPDVMPYYPYERAVKRGIDLSWGKQQIGAQIVSSILLGDSIATIANKLQERIETMNRTSAIRTARTAYTAAQNGGRQAAYERAADMGIQVRKQWSAVKDLRTRYNHGHADGQIVPYNEPFTVGGEKLMFPGDGSLGASAGNLYNCRCRSFTVEKEGIEAEPTMMRVRNPITGRNELVKEMTYAEWYKWKTGEDFSRNTTKDLANAANQSIINFDSLASGSKDAVRYMSIKDQFYKNLENVPPLEGFKDIACHADPFLFSFNDPETGETVQELTAQQFYNRLVNDGVKFTQPIRLFSCESGKYEDGLAQQFANLVGVNVLAPTKEIFTVEQGYVVLADDEDDAAELIRTAKEKWNQEGWVLFEPKGKK